MLSTLFSTRQRFSVGALALASCVVAIPGVLGQLRDGIAGWILHRDPWLTTISEFQPLFAPRPALQQGPLRAAVMGDLLQQLGVPRADLILEENS